MHGVVTVVFPVWDPAQCTAITDMVITPQVASSESSALSAKQLSPFAIPLRAGQCTCCVLVLRKVCLFTGLAYEVVEPDTRPISSSAQQPNKPKQ